jgi:phosphatidylglycerol:prolipoprotein diacylglycerol transferase
MFVHRIDPVITTVFGVHLWWYGLSYALGFVSAHLFLRRRRRQLGLSLASVYTLTLLLAIGVLIGGRAIVINNEWVFYRDHRDLIPALWIGGLATHGLIIGGAAGVAAFCLATRRPWRSLFDALAVAAALILASGRIGNFIDGQILGQITTMPWGVQFPDAPGFRHPVVLYDGLKNLALVPILVALGRRRPPPGRVAAWFMLLYAAPRILIDLLREYPLTLLGLPSGQTFNIGMTLVGVALLAKSYLAPGHEAIAPPQHDCPPGWRRAAFALLLLFVLVIPSDATRDVPVRYGARHPGMVHSRLYPALPDLP